MKYLNHIILGDTTYGNKTAGISRQMLHSYRLRIKHPITQKDMELVAPIPTDFREACKTYGLDVAKIEC